jgi:membrane-associated protease RseP (regulator of RpoE activity)
MKMIRATSLILLIAFFAPAAEEKADTKPEKPGKPVVVPFELLKSGHMAVQVMVNDTGPYLLIFDTGAPMSLVNNKLAKDSGLFKGKAKNPFTMFGSQGNVKIKKLSVGEQSAEDIEAIVMDHPTVDALARALDKPLYGIVGFPFFARFKMTLDYKAKTMTLVPSGYKPPDIMKAMTTALMGSGAKTLAPAGQFGLIATKEVGDKEPGVDVKEVLANSPAAKAGLKRGDRLLTLDGRWTDTMPDLFEAASLVILGDPVELKVKRGGKTLMLKVTPSRGI